MEPREIVRMIGGEDRFGILPLRHDAFQAKLAGVVEHGSPSSNSIWRPVEQLETDCVAVDRTPGSQ